MKATAAPPSPTTLAFDQVSQIRIVGRLTAAFLLDAIAIARGDSHPLDTLLAAAIVQANVAEITHRAELQEAFVEDDEMPSDEMRRPVSISAVANSLGLPFETVRRRINAMVRDGHCQAVHGGVIVPSAVLVDPKNQLDAFRAYERLRAFYYELRRYGALKELPPAAVHLSGDNFPVRTVSRLTGAFVLRIIETLGLHGDIVDSLILLETFRSNIAHVPQDRAGGILDAERAPVPVSVLAANLGLPPETVRRRVAVLVERGVCVRSRGGLIVPAQKMVEPRAFTTVATAGANLQRLFASLSRLGVLALWDELEPAATV